MIGRDPARGESGTRKGTRPCSREHGFSYVEVLVATALIALVLGSALDGLSTGILGARVHVSLAEEGFHLSSRLEEVLAQPFDALDAEAVLVGGPGVATSYSDAPGSTRRRLVYLSRYDADDADGDADRFTGVDDGLLWVRVQLENTERSLQTLSLR